MNMWRGLMLLLLLVTLCLLARHRARHDGAETSNIEHRASSIEQMGGLQLRKGVVIDSSRKAVTGVRHGAVILEPGPNGPVSESVARQEVPEGSQGFWDDGEMYVLPDDGELRHLPSGSVVVRGKYLDKLTHAAEIEAEVERWAFGK